jgi:phosphoglycerol transferase
MMKAEFDEALNAEDRMNYLVVLGDDIEPAQITRDAAMFDVMPTLLDLLGFELNKQRSGLGVSLLSENKTLAEQHGYSKLNEFIASDRLLAHKAWLDRKEQSFVALQ